MRHAAAAAFDERSDVLDQDTEAAPRWRSDTWGPEAIAATTHGIAETDA